MVFMAFCTQNCDFYGKITTILCDFPFFWRCLLRLHHTLGDVLGQRLILGAVIFFGALISAGNERQHKALDGIQEQAAL